MGFGEDIGKVRLENGDLVDDGRALIKGTWNAAFHEPLQASFNESQKLPLPDVLFHKTRPSGLWDDSTELAQYLAGGSIRTLLFCGMRTDQGVLSTITHAQTRGFDTILLNDACATDSLSSVQQNTEWQCSRNGGFLSSCKALTSAVASRAK